MLIVTLPLGADRRIREILKAVEVLPLDVRLSDFSDDPAFRRRGGARAGRHDRRHVAAASPAAARC